LNIFLTLSTLTLLYCAYNIGKIGQSNKTLTQINELATITKQLTRLATETSCEVFELQQRLNRLENNKKE
jgi:hypothetical protein